MHEKVDHIEECIEIIHENRRQILPREFWWGKS